MGLYDATLGTLLIGIFFNTFLFGLVTYQFAAYYRRKFDDQPATKHTVFFLFLLDIFHSGALIYMAWYYAVENYGNPAALAVGVWPYPFTAIGTALSALVTQLYLGFRQVQRIWCLTNSKILYGVVIVLAIPSFMLGFACGTAAWIIHINSELNWITPLVIAWLSLQIIVDLFITITSVIIFTRSRTGFRKMDTIVNKLIRGAVQTVLFAGLFSVGDLISFIVLPNTNIYGMFSVCIGRIYTNMLLDTLLTRETLKGEMEGTDYMSGEPASLCWETSQPLRTAQTTSLPLRAQKASQESHSSCHSVDGQVPPLHV